MVAAASSWAGLPPGATAASWAPVRMPSVVVLTLSGRDVPNGRMYRQPNRLLRQVCLS